MNKLVEKINETLINHNLTLDNGKVLDEYQKVEEAWNGIVSKAKTPIKYLIVGEATVSFKNYFYKPDSAVTSFLNPSHFNCKEKDKNELIDLFQKNGVVVFDLYPLPLPTFIYDNVKFNCKDPVYVRLLNEYYEDKLSGVIDKNTKIVLRYKKLLKRCEWKVLIKFLEREKEVHLNISKDINADEAKIKKIFNSIIT